jgi:hypothetical protein
VEIVFLENVQVLEEEDLSLNSETPALNSGHIVVEPCLNRETLALNSNPIRTPRMVRKSAVSANTQGTLSVASCKSVYTKNGKHIGKGEPLANHYWTKRHAEEAFEKEVLRQKQAAMVKKKFLKPPQPSVSQLSRRGRR